MLQKTLKVLDGFLHSQTLSNPESRLRGRFAAAISLFDIFTVTYLIVSSEFWKSTGDALIWLYILFLCANCLCLYLIKISSALGTILVFMTCIISSQDILDIFVFSKSLLAPSVYDLTSVILVSFLFCPERGNRIFIGGWMIACTGLCWAFADKIGFHLPPGVTDPQGVYLNQTMVYAAFALGTIFFYLKIKSITQEELDHEREWEARSSRLGEISAIVKTMHALMNRPLQIMQSGWNQLGKHEVKQDGESEIVPEIQRSLDELLQISQSYAWLYKAYRYEEGFAASADSLVKQLEVLVSSDAKKSGWILHANPLPPGVTIHGPIPSIMLLLFTIITQILNGSQPADSRILSIHLEHDSEKIHWTISWPFAIGLEAFSAESALRSRQAREELIADLSQDCNATVREHIDERTRFVRVAGSWARPLPA